MYITILVKQVYWYISQVSGERLQDHWSSGLIIVPILKGDSPLNYQICRLVMIMMNVCLRVCCFDLVTLGCDYLLTDE